MKTVLIGLSFAMIVFSCTKKHGPEEILQKYVDYRFSASQSRDGALEMLTGELKQKMSEMSEEELKIYLSAENLKKKSLQIQSSNCSSNICNIVYILKYERTDKGKEPYMVENKKEAVLNLEDKDWKISDVKNIKTYIEAPEIGISSKAEDL